MTVNVSMLILSLALLLLIQLIQATQVIRLHGQPYALSPRDNPVDVGVLGGRIQRAKVNLVENLMLFAPLSVLAEALKSDPKLVAWGAAIFFVARVLHFPLYLAGIALVRTLAWLAGVIGCVLIALAILGWA